MIGKLVALLTLICMPVAAMAKESRPAADGAATLPAIGRTVDDFTLRDFRGKEHSLSQFADKPLVVLYFFGTQCPLAKHYSLRLQRMNEEYADKGVAFIGINSNVQDSLSQIENHVRVHTVQFPALKDVGNVVADRLGATRTPEVFVLDADRRIRYHGRVDAQYTFGSGVGLAAPVEKRADLQIALDELLAGKEVSVATTEPKGCIIGRVRPQQDGEVTYSNQIARIFQNRCVECHREGQIAPFAMTNFNEVSGWGEMIAEVVEQQRMPPWHADPTFGHFQNDTRLSDHEKQQIFAWVDKGCPEGDPADLPEPIAYNETWYLPEEPDEVFYMTEQPVTIQPEGTEPYRYYIVDPGFKEDKWVRLAEARPGNRAVVHHIIVFIQPPGAASEITGIRGCWSVMHPVRDRGISPGLGQEDPSGLQADLSDALHADRLRADRPQHAGLGLHRRIGGHASGRHHQCHPAGFQDPATCQGLSGRGHQGTPARRLPAVHVSSHAHPRFGLQVRIGNAGWAEADAVECAHV